MIWQMVIEVREGVKLRLDIKVRYINLTEENDFNVQFGEQAVIGRQLPI